MDEKVRLGITAADLQEDVIDVLIVRKLNPTSELSHRLPECRASAARVGVDGDLVLCDVRSNARIQPDDATMARVRYHSDGTEASCEGLGGAHGESLRRVRASGSSLHHLAVSLAGVAVCICRNRHRTEICWRRGRREEASWGDRLLLRKLKPCCFMGEDFYEFGVCILFHWPDL